MPSPSFSNLNPILFLQTFVLELLHACEQYGSPKAEYIENIAHSAGRFFEECYRNDHGLKGPLDLERYVDLILGLKNQIGGNFSLDSSQPGNVRVVNNRCPFGPGVRNFPELCRMTSSVFGGIAARNFGYAKVDISECIARGHEHCRVCIYLDRNTGHNQPGKEYLNLQESRRHREEISALTAQIDTQLHKLWLQTSKAGAARSSPIEPIIIAESPPMRKVVKAIHKLAPTNATVLIQGETGVGKELIAKAIHALSPRANRPFIAINCGAIPETLIESTLFGHEKGAFTGAIDVHQGVFERAEGGTLFLDEVNSLSSATQVRLLRALQEGEIERVGGKRTFTVDVRILAATNQDLEELVRTGIFREDLFYRIHVVKLLIPPLRERQEDLPALVQLILQRLSKKYHQSVVGVSRLVMEQIRHYPWPGNIRELENTLERSFLFAEGPELTYLDLAASKTTSLSWRKLKHQLLVEEEKRCLIDALRNHRGNVAAVAQAMGLTTRSIYLKLKRHGLSASAYRIG
jgi:two-component system response regulator HydG